MWPCNDNDNEYAGLHRRIEKTNTNTKEKTDNGRSKLERERKPEGTTRKMKNEAQQTPSNYYCCSAADAAIQPSSRAATAVFGFRMALLLCCRSRSIAAWSITCGLFLTTEWCRNVVVVPVRNTKTSIITEQAKTQDTPSRRRGSNQTGFRIRVLII